MFTFNDSGVGWALVSSGTEGQPEINYLPDYLSISCDYAKTETIYSQRRFPGNLLKFT